ncbi:hypothetical protein XBP1_390021 [Xenorhabdus bovienii str. puntauvense]|uniref:Uncharacterized protein n=1 Tax=Xenorhabdus bovienii str. puntauvense TaxID=1398201 RepID=A0A077NJE4_XENBV|nr:hypothetical protein [Xenorhabdus bovienii]CDG98603.1 hypothetical protein XBP1_390021 [Xenorhabdus bovienii str. puntauvense]
MGKKANESEADVCQFDTLDEFLRFRKAFPEKMKNNYNYVLSDGIQENGFYKVIESGSYFKSFKKKLKKYISEGMS